jgi:hypothetical protein
MMGMTMRTIGMLLLLSAVLGLCIYNARTNPWISVSDCLEDPEAYDGKMVARYREPMIGEIFPDGFRLLQKQAPSIRVFSDTTGLVSGEFVGMRAIFHKQGYLEAISIHVAKRRRHKIGISVVPVFFIGFLLWKYFNWNRKKRWIEVK